MSRHITAEQLVVIACVHELGQPKGLHRPSQFIFCRDKFAAVITDDWKI